MEWSPLIAELPKPDREQRWDWPTLCFAAWDEPNEEGQKPIFGSVGLTGGELLQYCLWYQGLSGLEKKEWDAFLATVKKGQPASRVNAFRFSNEPAESQSYQSVAAGDSRSSAGCCIPKRGPQSSRRRNGSWTEKPQSLHATLTKTHRCAPNERQDRWRSAGGFPIVHDAFFKTRRLTPAARR